jgi:hypothetical protein
MNKGTKSLQSAIRLESRRVLREYTFTKTTQELFADIIEGKLQKMIKQAVAKLAPIKSVEMRIARLEENTKVIVTDKEVESEKVTIRSKDEGEKHLSEEEIKAQEEAKAAAIAEDIAKGVRDAPLEDDADDDSSDDFGDDDDFDDEDFGDDDEDSDDEDSDDDSEEDSDEVADDEVADDDSDEDSEKKAK